MEHKLGHILELPGIRTGCKLGMVVGRRLGLEHKLGWLLEQGQLGQSRLGLVELELELGMVELHKRRLVGTLVLGLGLAPGLELGLELGLGQEPGQGMGLGRVG